MHKICKLIVISIHSAYYHTHVPPPIYSWTTQMLNKQGKILYSRIYSEVYGIYQFMLAPTGALAAMMCHQWCLWSLNLQCTTAPKAPTKKGVKRVKNASGRSLITFLISLHPQFAEQFAENFVPTQRFRAALWMF